MRREVSRDGADGFGVHAGGAAYNVQVMLIREVEEEYVVCLAVDAFAYRVGLVGYERSEYAEVPHAGDYVVPVSLTQVQVRFFGEEENGFQLPACQRIH